jgi:ABC-type amino acid transport system permease subunit
MSTTKTSERASAALGGWFAATMMDLQPVWDWFRVLHATTGIKLTIFYDTFDRVRFLNGFLTSIRLMALCLACSVAIGIVGAWVQGSQLKLLRAVTQAYIVFRNTPPLVSSIFLLCTRIVSADANEGPDWKYRSSPISSGL